MSIRKCLDMQIKECRRKGSPLTTWIKAVREALIYEKTDGPWETVLHEGSRFHVADLATSGMSYDDYISFLRKDYNCKMGQKHCKKVITAIFKKHKVTHV